jgi:HAD superfamily hydrolase (TIGR01549 family)
MSGNYDSVIFDMDGVILDSGLDDFQWMDRIRMQKASELGYDMDKEDAVQVVQATEMSQIRELLERFGMEREELLEIEHRVQNAKIELIEHGVIRLFPESERLLKDLDIPVGLATNSPYQAAQFTLNYYGIKNHFDRMEALKLDELEKFVRRKKPHGYMLETIREELGLENPVMVGDSGSDIKAAENAGVDSILVQSYSDGDHLDPTHKVRNLTELKSFLK